VLARLGVTLNGSELGGTLLKIRLNEKNRTDLNTHPSIAANTRDIDAADHPAASS
jgi:hypothetical protein